MVLAGLLYLCTEIARKPDLHTVSSLFVHTPVLSLDFDGQLKTKDTMYSVAVLSTLLATALSAALPSQRVNYDGYRVVRIGTEPAGDDLYTIQGMVKDLKLSTWNVPTVPGANVDLMIPPKQIKKFETLSKDFKVQVLHKDLGADMQEEKTFGMYKGK